MKNVFLISGLSGLAACAGMFLSTSDCAASFGGHGGVGEPYDVGGGLVANEGGDSSPDETGRDNFSFVEIEDCRSGRNLFVTYSSSRTDYDDKIVIPQKYDASRFGEFKAKMSEAATSIGLDGIVESARDFGYSAREYAAIYQNGRAETCRCRVLYPELRGDKKPYEAS
ncbi:MAG: hypothetical protein H6901_05825 [Rhodobacteraceae bacterium]|nr:hypothetical protein [Paracoccaceae bacterium]MCP5341713.1 hypothetical protein [Paracoccaceae bacterium]